MASGAWALRLASRKFYSAARFARAADDHAVPGEACIGNGRRKNRLHKVLDSCGVKLGCVVSNMDGVSAHAMIEALIEGRKNPDEIAAMAKGRLRVKASALRLALDARVSDRHRYLLGEIQKHIKWLDEELSQVDEQVLAAMRPYEQAWRLVQTMPGFDELSAVVLLAEIGTDMKRFGSKEQLSSWAGVCPGNNESAGKRKSAKMPKGSRHLKRTLCEAAHSAVKTNSQFKGMFSGLVIRRGKKRAIMSVAHRLSEIAFVILKKEEPYRDGTVDYEKLMVKKNAPRWIRALQRYGYSAPAQT